MDNFQLSEVFTPATPAKLTFVDRLKVNDRIVRALKMPGKQIVVYGYSGSGKTTLIENKLFQVYEKHIRTNCMKNMTFDQVVLDAFDQLGGFYCDKIVDGAKNKVDASLQAAYLGIKSSIAVSSEASSSQEQKRILPPQLTPQSLARFMGAAGYCWILEDFHKMSDEHKESLAQMMKVFMDISHEFNDLKIVAIGAVNTAREIVRADKEMKRRISEIHVDLMSDDEILSIIKKGETLLNVHFDNEIKKEIIHYSNGLASICHSLCYILCDLDGIYQTVLGEPHLISDVIPAIEEYLNEESDTMKCALDKALKIKHAEDVIRVISSNGQDGMTFDTVLEKLNRIAIKHRDAKLQSILTELCGEESGSIIKFDNDSGRYSFSDPFLQSFARAFFEEKDNREGAGALTERELHALLNKAFAAIVANNKSLSAQFSGDLIGNKHDENKLKTHTEIESR
ncbi:hypothetical protein [Chitinibacter sp. GC72]|uniref:hypothetical protein n=1 Tax=Chitinibacter sp. GC72 TaxID=1526917 RepID=UPI0012FA75F4|nr:hypothetical protein [Chitinibacter sp. GC72]